MGHCDNMVRGVVRNLELFAPLYYLVYIVSEFRHNCCRLDTIIIVYGHDSMNQQPCSFVGSSHDLSPPAA